MNSHHFESFSVRFTGKNYSSWEFQFQLFVTGKELWGHIDGSDPTPTDATKLGHTRQLRPCGITYKRFTTKIIAQDAFNIVYAKIPTESLSVIQAVHEQSKRDQFLMKLRSDFESVRSNLMNCDPSPSLDVCFRELLREEQHLVTQNAFKKENDVTVAFAAQGHIIKECPTRPQNRRINVFQAGINGSTNDNSSSGQVLTPEMVQQMIMSAFSALGLQGNDVTSNFWIVDSSASNHMTNSTSILKNVRKYQGPSQLQIANGSNLPITKDQVSGTIIAKGPKVGRLFPIHFSIPPVLSFACTSTASKTELLPLIVLLVN
ncbi:hypothetical protein KY290_031197 [Solanum tuberosum]|uniref:Retrotransposon Copia-like N-terminal domain-containing protein n=1 Tax=Solanum tuberosum TaxID=4113 RepID=A0ABQ7U9A9_SOLTU|nr:hypothetical protein KY290_031197 [Solanum tuberosum]